MAETSVRLRRLAALAFPLKRAGWSVAILVVALVLTLLAFRLPLGASLQLIFEGGLGDRFGLSRSAVKMTPLLLTGLGMVIAWRAGMYNIGGEGQFVVGGLVGAWVARAAPDNIHGLPAALMIVAILAGCVAGGAAWAWLAGWLWVRRGVAVVISTIMLNFIAEQLLAWASSGPLQERAHQVPLTEQLPDALMLPKWNPQMDLHLGVALALVAAVGVHIFLFYTRAGFRLRVVGESPAAARANLLGVPGEQMRAMLISGALCGLAGGFEYTGMTGQLGVGFSQQWGFIGIPVALIAGLSPLGVIASAAYFGVLFAGTENLARFTESGTTLVYVIQAVAVLGLVAVRSVSVFKRRPAAVGEAA